MLHKESQLTDIKFYILLYILEDTDSKLLT